MTAITKKALRGNDTALPKSGQESLGWIYQNLWQNHLRKTYGLRSGHASLLSNLIDMGTNPYGH